MFSVPLLSQNATTALLVAVIQAVYYVLKVCNMYVKLQYVCRNRALKCIAANRRFSLVRYNLTLRTLHRNERKGFVVMSKCRGRIVSRLCVTEQILGWCSGKSARLLPVWPGFDSRTRRHMWVEFVVGSLLAPRGFSPDTPGFPSPQKPTFLNSNSIWNSKATGLSVARLLGVTLVKQS